MLKDTSPMTSSLPLKYWCSLIALFCIATTCCKSDQDPVDIVDKALACFNDHYVYSSCQDSYRLNAGGTFNVPPEATDQYCGGPCLVETKLLLNCIDGILYNFRFYNGASIQEVRHTLNTGCGHTNRRGDFDVSEDIGANPDGYGDYYGHGNKLAIPINLLILLSCVLLLSG